jgi:hypothetical protein
MTNVYKISETMRKRREILRFCDTHEAVGETDGAGNGYLG